MTSRTTSRSRHGGGHGRAVKLRRHPPLFANQPELARVHGDDRGVERRARSAALLARFVPRFDRRRSMYSAVVIRPIVVLGVVAVLGPPLATAPRASARASSQQAPGDTPTHWPRFRGPDSN